MLFCVISFTYYGNPMRYYSHLTKVQKYAQTDNLPKSNNQQKAELGFELRLISYLYYITLPPLGCNTHSSFIFWCFLLFSLTDLCMFPNNSYLISHYFINLLVPMFIAYIIHQIGIYLMAEIMSVFFFFVSKAPDTE